MGQNEKILGEINLHDLSDYEPTKHVIEWTDAFHIHWRNMLFYLDKKEFEQFMTIGAHALQRWHQLGQPDIRDDDMNIGLAGAGGLNFKHGMHSNYGAIEQLREDHFHFNYRSLRIDLSRKELIALCDMFEETKKNLLTGGGKDVGKMTTDEYFKSKKESKQGKTDTEQFFENIKNVDYVVMRWFDGLPNKFHPIHDDVDMLVMDDQKHLVPRKPYCDDNDIRGISDNYFPPEKGEEMIRTAIIHNGVKVPNRKNYFLSMAYHILFHKFLDGGIPTKIEPFASEYRARGENRFPEYYQEIESLARCFDYDDEITLEFLYKLLKKEGWKPYLNAPSGVIHDIPLLKQFIEVLENESST